jgi:uncharacterized membrane protein YgcG
VNAVTRRILRIFVLALGAIVSTAAAQDGARTLHWRRIDVDARLDAAGRLRVIERQAMVFTGDWNGGERTFNLRPGQQLDLNGITRIDPDGSALRLQRGDLDGVDEFDWTTSKTLRWRSRLPTDPPFDNQQIIYELDYTLSNILNVDGDAYQLDHDFAFPDRVGIIENLSLAFAAADVWRSSTPLPFKLERTDIPPGASVVVTIPLQYTGAGQPAGVARGLPLAGRVLLALILVVVVGWMLRRFFAEEKSRGRFEPIVPAEAVNQEWLSRHVFNLPPEVVGAAWDNTTSAPEVAAMIARMVLEGKLASRVESKKWKDILHLDLKVPRADLSGDERKLVDALFESGRDQTDTERIKQRYKKSGFDPAKLISEDIKKQINALTPNRQAGIDWGRVMVNVAVVLLVVVTGFAALGLAGGSVVTAAPIIVAFIGLIALVHAVRYRTAVVDTERKARLMTVFLLLAAAPILAVTLGLLERGAALSLTPMIAPANAGWLLVVALVVMFLGIAFLVLRAARTREDPGRLELRRTLAAGRAFFVRELRRPQPKLDDAWFPYLLAFGLGKHIDKWFRAFGAPHDSRLTGASAAAVASASGSGWSGGGPLFGGGGGFGGGGTGRTWAASVATLSAGVSAPSSSGSGGGGGGGGGSSGGGGGGGW